MIGFKGVFLCIFSFDLFNKSGESFYRIIFIGDRVGFSYERRFVDGFSIGLEFRFSFYIIFNFMGFCSLCNFFRNKVFRIILRFGVGVVELLGMKRVRKYFIGIYEFK